MHTPGNSGTPYNVGMNRAKRIARAADRRDTLAVRANLGPGFPRQHEHHKELVAIRHRYYHDLHGGGSHEQPVAS